MGLPDLIPFYGGQYEAVAPSEELWKSPCGRHPDVDLHAIDYGYFASDDPAEGWVDYVMRNEGRSILFEDENCNPATTRLQAEFYPRRVLGIRLDGGLSVKKGFGDRFGLPLWEKSVGAP